MNGKIITFYSYKGGVGRTMALANTAVLLANRHDLKVIAIDWDLEAPGLHYYFGLQDNDLTNQHGLIDFFQTFMEGIDKPDGEMPDIISYAFEPPYIKEQLKYGSVKLITAGKKDNEYGKKVQEFNWNNFYEKNEGYRCIEYMKDILRQNADLILVDSRTGITDIGSICTLQIPDILVFLFSANYQNLEAVKKLSTLLFEESKKYKIEKEDDILKITSPVKIFLVPSGVPKEETSYTKWLDKADKLFEELAGSGTILKEVHPKGIQTCVIPYIPRYSFSENELPALEKENSSNSLTDEYVKLTTFIYNFYIGENLWRSQPSDTIGLLKSRLDRAEKRKDKLGTAKILFELGKYYIKNEKYNNANNTFVRATGILEAIESDELHIRTLLELYNLNKQIESSDEELVLSYYEKAMEISDDSADLWNKKGMMLSELGLYGEALKAYGKAVELNPDFVEAWNRKGIVLDKLSRYDEALNAYDKAVELKPDFVGAFNNKGIVLSKLSRYEEALEAYDRAIELNPDFHETWNNKGMTLSELKRYKEALEAYTKTTELNPEFVEGWNRKGIALAKLGLHTAEALEAYEKAIKLKTKLL